MQKIVLACGLVLLPWAAQAQQADFNLSYIEDTAKYAYSWADWAKSNKRIEFVVPVDVLKASMTDFTAFEPFEANQEIARRLEVEAAHRLPDIKMTITPMAGGIKYTAVAEEKEAAAAMKEIQALEKEVRTAYLAERYYTFAKDNVLMPDHARIASIYSRKMEPLGQALLGQMSGTASTRDMMNVAISFFQTIPYDTLKDRYTSSGAGFETPLRMLAQNRGDCDSKSVAYLSLLRYYYPDLPLLMVYTPYHAFVGISIPAQNNDTIIDVDGLKYVLAEPVGPAMVPLGQVSPEALGELRKGVYSWRVVPPG